MRLTHPLRAAALCLTALPGLAGCALTDGLADGAAAPPLAAESWINAIEADDIVLEERSGRHVVIEFWSADCPQCRRAIPRLQGLHERYGDAPLDVVSVHLTLDGAAPAADAAALRRFVTDAGITYPVGLDQTGRSWDDYEFEYLPHAVVVDPLGMVVWSGNPTLYSLERAVADAVGPVPAPETTPTKPGDFADAVDAEWDCASCEVVQRPHVPLAGAGTR